MTPRRFLAQEVLPRLLPAHRRVIENPVGCVRVVGLFTSPTGLGEAARLAVHQLDAAGWPVEVQDVSRWFGGGGAAIKFQGGKRQHSGSDITLMVLNPPMLHAAALLSGLRRYYRSYAVGCWAWELETLPAAWVRALAHVDAVIVPSFFTQRAVGSATRKPVHVVAHGVRPPSMPRLVPRSERFRVLSVFNFGSSLQRKNPAALVRAFRMAFGEDRSAELLLKTADGAQYTGEVQRLCALIQGLGNVRHVDGALDEEERSALLQSADVYASLHRSEGFGLTLAEAIMAEVPVVVTDWSGSADFCLPELCYPVTYQLTRALDSHPDFREIGYARWAEPSVSSAAANLAAVRRDRETAQAKARGLRRALELHLEAHTLPAALMALGARPSAARSVR